MTGLPPAPGIAGIAGMGGIGGVAVFHCGLAAAVLFLPMKMLFTRVPVLRIIDLERDTVPGCGYRPLSFR